MLEMDKVIDDIDPNSLSNEEYFEWLNKQPLSKKEYYKLFFARLKRNKEAIKMILKWEKIKNDE